MIDIGKYEIILLPLFQKYEIYNTLRISHFLAQIDHESNGLKTLQENLNYSVEGLTSTFSRSRITLSDCQKYGRRPGRPANREMIANIIYGGAFGVNNLGNTVFGDGWKYRGRGPLQCTGKANYKRYSDYSKIDFVNNPNLMSELQYGFEFACWYWKTKGLNELADNNLLRKITTKINGGSIGYDQRQKLFNQYFKSQHVVNLAIKINKQ